MPALYILLLYLSFKQFAKTKANIVLAGKAVDIAISQANGIPIWKEIARSPVVFVVAEVAAVEEAAVVVAAAVEVAVVRTESNCNQYILTRVKAFLKRRHHNIHEAFILWTRGPRIIHTTLDKT